MRVNPRERVLLGLLVMAAILPRAGLLWKQADNLSLDVDAYLGIAHNLADGNGYSSPGTSTPTAFRPPLYPIMLAGILKSGGGDAAIGLFHLLLGTWTVLLTFVVGSRLGLGRASFAAAAVVTLDPLLLRYTTLPMTETTFTFLVILLIAVSVPDAARDSVTTQSVRHSHFRRAMIGVIFGLCGLCRPTIWLFGLAAGGWWFCRTKRKRMIESAGECRATFPWPTLLAAALTVSPWLVRNLVVFGRPILTTTHGGYTLLLGNNPVFYREVVAGPWGTVWQEDSLRAWNETLEQEMAREVPPIKTEPDRDRWMYRRAWRNITDDPGAFLRACWLRLRRFWNVAPLGPVRESVPLVVRWAVAGFYVVITTGLILCLARLRVAEWRNGMPLILLVLSFFVVHLLFWSNTRMRAPLIPAIALLSVRGWCGQIARLGRPRNGHDGASIPTKRQ